MDDCPHTDKKIKVDLNGCPVDSDKDGVPDHLDKEPNSKNFKYVDELLKFPQEKSNGNEFYYQNGSFEHYLQNNLND